MKLLYAATSTALIMLLTSTAFAEVSSKPCPYSCNSQGLSRDTCKDWREGNTCFVENLKAQSRPTAENLKREIVMVNKHILAGKTLELSLPNNNPIDHLDAVVRREGGSTQTELSAALGSSIQFGTQQVDGSKNQVLQFPANGTRSEGRKLILSANNGDVFIESVHFMTR
jgi:hypothetical protein